jgi:hypothetical protein
MTDPQGTAILPEFLRSNLKWPIQALPPKKSWEVWKRPACKQFLLSKLGRLRKADLEESLGNFTLTDDNHQTWRWEHTGENLISENTFILSKYQQTHYASYTT